MAGERIVKQQSVFEDKFIGSIRGVSQMMSFLPEINPHDQRFVEVYTRIQLLIVDNKRKKAKRLSDLLNKFTGFNEFEESHQDVLAAVDLAIRGENRRNVNPALNRNHKG